MVSLVARQGRELQRYTDEGCRIVVGCIPYRFKDDMAGEDATPIDHSLELLVISAQKGREIMFPKGGWEEDETIEAAASREAMEEAGVHGEVEEELGRWWYESKTLDSRKWGILFPLNVTEELLHWPEMGNRKRRWVSLAEARESCQQIWMKEALEILVIRLSCLPREHCCASPLRTNAEQPCQESETRPIEDSDRSKIKEDGALVCRVDHELHIKESVFPADHPVVRSSSFKAIPCHWKCCNGAYWQFDTFSFLDDKSLICWIILQICSLFMMLLYAVLVTLHCRKSPRVCSEIHQHRYELTPTFDLCRGDEWIFLGPFSKAIGQQISL